MSHSAAPTLELDMAIAVARGFCLGDDPLAWSDDAIASTADAISEAGSVDRDRLALSLVFEREATKRRRH